MIRPTLTILDGTNILMENGPTGGDPSNVKNADAILAATGPVAMTPGRLSICTARSYKGAGKQDYIGRIKAII